MGRGDSRLIIIVLDVVRRVNVLAVIEKVHVIKGHAAINAKCERPSLIWIIHLDDTADSGLQRT